MAANNTTVSYDFTSASSSMYLCQKVPYLIWDFTDTTLPWILDVVIFIAAPIATILNILVIVALMKSRALKRLSNILLRSMAVTDLATGAITMPMSAILDVLMLNQVSVEHMCTFDSVVNKSLIFLMSSSSLYHVTAIAWERHMAVKCLTDYRNKVTKRLLKVRGATAWLLAILKQIPTVAMAIIGVDRKIVDRWLALEIILVVTCLFAIAYFYIMVFLGLRKQRQNQTSQVASMIKAKLESNVAKTTGLLTAGLLISFVPSIVIATLGNFFPVFRTNSTFRLSEVFVQFNSVLTPVLYFYRDRRFRNAVQQLLQIKISTNNQYSVDAAQSSKKNDSSTASKEIPAYNGKTISSIQITFSSTEIAGKVDEELKAVLVRSISDPMLYKCPRDSVVPCGSPPDEPSSPIAAITTVQRKSSQQCKGRNSKGKVYPLPTHTKYLVPLRSSTDLTRTKSRSKSCDNETYVNISDCFQWGQEANKTNSKT